MKSFNTCKLLFAIAVTFGFCVVSNLSVVSASPQQGCDCSSQSCITCRQSGGCVHCPECSESFVPPPQEYCELNITEGKETRTCFEIDYKTICIPKVVPPWRQCCEPVCAEARSVKVLKTRKYECPVCKYEWSVKKPEFQQPATSNLTYPNQLPVNSFPVAQPYSAGAPVTQGMTQSRGSAGLPGYTVPQRSNVPVFPAGSGVPIIPARTSGAPSFVVPAPSAAPPAPPTNGSIGDYFGGR